MAREIVKYFGRPHWGIGITLMALTAPAAFATPPIAYDGYTVTNGVITAPCPPAAISCTGLVSDNGFMERQVKTSTGTYIQFILTDIGVSGDPTAAAFSAARGSINFTNEDFVKLGNRTNGIASKQTLFESEFSSPTAEDRFTTTTEYAFGWAQIAPEPWIHVSQAATSLDYSVNPLNPKEIFNSSADIKSSNTSFSSDQNIDLTQQIDLLDGDSQGFKYKEVSGIYNLTNHPPDGPTPLLPGGTNSGNITWVLGNKITATWVGQDLTDGSDDSYTGGVFGYTRYAQTDSLDNILQETHLASLSNPFSSGPSPSADPVNWMNPPFGPAPTVAYNVFQSPTAVVTPPVGLTPAGPNVNPMPETATGTANGPPIAYDQWTVSGGTVSASCPGCSDVTTVVSANGILQRFFTFGGRQYIQTIITDNGVTGNPANAPFTSGALGFREEDFVRSGLGPNQEGIASQMHIENQNLAYKSTPASTPLPTTGGNFLYDVALNIGWANNASDPLAPFITVDQSIEVPDNLPPTSTSMYNGFHMDARPDGQRIRIEGATGTEAIGDTTIPLIIIGGAGNCTLIGGTVSGSNCVIPGTGYVKPVMFVTDIESGAYQNTTHTLLDPDLLPSNGGNIPWSTGDAIQATWMGARYTASDPLGEQNVALTSYTNLSTGQRIQYVSDQYPPRTIDPNPDSWVDPPFGVAPTWMSPYTPP